ncbi:MAG: putative glycoside hydrolase [Oscillospiraceae bacterium]|nr:putative glycoside hydrolase [Oscillospiraceae bacterium]
MARKNYYHPYRGRSGLNIFLRILLALVLVVVVAGLIAFFYLRQHLVVSQDGVHLDLPFAQQKEEEDAEESASPSQDSQEEEGGEDTDGEDADGEETAPIVITEDEEAQAGALSPVSLGQEALYDGTAVEQVEAAGGDCALFDMKPDTGVLSYRSVLELSFSEALSTLEPEDLNKSIVALNKTDGLYTVARVSCFKDGSVPRYEYSYSILTNSGYRWQDPAGIYWISPTSEDMQDYLTGVCVELARLGFDEILLDNAGYPNEGHLEYIRRGDAYNLEELSTVIAAFYEKVRLALEDYDVTLSIVTTQAVLDGTEELTGQTTENLASADRLWMADEDGTLLPISQEDGEN